MSPLCWASFLQDVHWVGFNLQDPHGLSDQEGKQLTRAMMLRAFAKFSRLLCPRTDNITRNTWLEKKRKFIKKLGKHS